MIKLPKTIKIGGRNWSVKCPHTFTDNANKWGFCDYGMQEIRLSDKCISGEKVHDEQLRLGLIHEVLHAIDYVYNNDKLEEDVVDRIGEGLLQLLQDNPEFVELFAEKK